MSGRRAGTNERSPLVSLTNSESRRLTRGIHHLQNGVTHTRSWVVNNAKKERSTSRGRIYPVSILNAVNCAPVFLPLPRLETSCFLQPACCIGQEDISQFSIRKGTFFYTGCFGFAKAAQDTGSLHTL